MVHLITGGQRSGKSSYGQKLALEMSDRPVYLATSRIWDDDHRNRVERHKQDRDHRWENLEEEKEISRFKLEGRVILVDCITLWLTNYYFDNEYDINKALDQAKSEMAKFLSYPNDIILITNELGMGVHPETEAGRKFADMQGWFNQHVANLANKVTLIISGIPVIIKQ